MNTSQLPVPDFYDAKHAADYGYRPDQQAVFEQATAWARSHDVRPSATDRRKVLLLLIDLQKDFCFPAGTLYVGGRSGRGAIEDNDRIARFVYRNLAAITDVTCTLDSHLPFQIFFAPFWVDADGLPLRPHTTIAVGDIREGRVQPNPAVAGWLTNGNYAFLRRQVEFYCEELEAAGKYTLYLWPPHCLLGSDGHALAGVIHEARLFHSFARSAPGRVEVKGGNYLTENYSVLAPEVTRRFDGKPLDQKNAQFRDALLKYDAIVVAGQAASHCVKSSIDDLLGELRTHAPGLVKKVFILRDCMSAVAVPDGRGGFLADYTDDAEAALRRFADAGMHVVTSDTPMADWPGMNG
ncbi:MAG: nicotinamidase [Gemmatimonadetes bacterium]|nr:nicotinamidase [Gemmatimonadota bacterium]